MRELTKSKSRRLKSPNGAGSLYRRSDGRWHARYTVRDPETGLSLRRSLYAQTEQEARALLVEALEARRKGLLSVRRGRVPTLEEYAKRWLAACEDRIRPRSIHRYRELLDNHVLPRLGKVQITQLEPRQVNAVMHEVRKRGLSVRTCNYVRVTLRAMLAEAQREGLVGRNAAALVRPFNDQREERWLSVLTPEQARILLEVVQEDRDGPLWMLAITTRLPARGAGRAALARFRPRSAGANGQEVAAVPGRSRLVGAEAEDCALAPHAGAARGRCHGVATAAEPPGRRAARRRQCVESGVRRSGLQEPLGPTRDEQYSDQALPEAAEDAWLAQGALSRSQALGGLPIGSSGFIFALGGRGFGPRPDQHYRRPLHTCVRDGAAGGRCGHGPGAGWEVRSNGL
jgi:Phage integrase, N-terminal SAM-like domain